MHSFPPPTGYLPFDDARNPTAPSLSVIWKGILGQAPSFRRSSWEAVSPEAKAFVTSLLDKVRVRVHWVAGGW